MLKNYWGRSTSCLRERQAYYSRLICLLTCMNGTSWPDIVGVGRQFTGQFHKDPLYPQPASVNFKIGRFDELLINLMNGVLDEVEIFNRALSEAEIKDIYDAGSLGKIKPEPIPPPVGMVSWWPGDGHTNDIMDGNHGTLVGGATYASGLVGQAFSLDGVDDYVDLGDIPTMDFSNRDFTIDAWFRIPDYPTLAPGCAPRYPIFSNYAWGYHTEVMEDGRLHFTKYYEFAAAVTVSSLDPVSTGDWHHVAAVHTLTELRIYVDGQLSNTADSPSGAIFYNSNGFDRPEIGRYSCNDPPDFYFKGLIDELEIFNRALSDVEIGAIYGAGSLGKLKPAPPEPALLPAGALSWWRADGDATDSSDGLNGTLVDGASFGPGMVGQAFSLDGLNDYVDLGDIPNLDFTNEDFSLAGC